MGFAGACVIGPGPLFKGSPRLAGQPAEYLRKALTRFRDKDPSRAGSVMMSIAANFSDADIAGLAAYLQNFPSDPIAAVKP